MKTITTKKHDALKAQILFLALATMMITFTTTLSSASNLYRCHVSCKNEFSDRSIDIWPKQIADADITVKSYFEVKALSQEAALSHLLRKCIKQGQSYAKSLSSKASLIDSSLVVYGFSNVIAALQPQLAWPEGELKETIPVEIPAVAARDCLLRNSL